MSTGVAITGSGLYTPPESISNDELVASYNAYVENRNREAAAGIAAGTAEPLPSSSSEFIVKASGIQSRHVVDKRGVLDIETMRPQIRQRSDDEPSLMCEMGLIAAQQALERAGRKATDVDAVLVACSNLQRASTEMICEPCASDLQSKARGPCFDRTTLRRGPLRRVSTSRSDLSSD